MTFFSKKEEDIMQPDEHLGIFFTSNWNDY